MLNGKTATGLQVPDELVERLGAVERDGHVVADPRFRQRELREADVARIVLHEEDLYRLSRPRGFNCH